MADRKAGLLLVMMQPPAALEEEFNAWYDTEHIPERAGIPGFRSALRYVALSGYPRYGAVYDLDDVAVLQSPGYMKFHGANFTPWTKRVTSRVQIYRTIAEQIFPGDAVTRRSSRLLVVRLRDVPAARSEETVAAFRQAFEATAAGIRVFRTTEGVTVDHFGLIEFSPPPVGEIDLGRLGALAPHVDLVNLYAPHELGG